MIVRTSQVRPRSWWRERREDCLAWLILTSAAFAGCLLALVAWRALVG